MKAEETKTLIPFEEAAEKKWFLSYRKASPKKDLEIKFDDGKSYHYYSAVKCDMGDTAVIDYGGATSYSMGQVVNIADNKNLKPTKAVRPLMIFSADPTKKDLKNNAPEERDLYRDDVTNKHIIDLYVMHVLDAITVLAFPELVDKEEIDAAKEYLKTKFRFPEYLISSKYFNILEFSGACGVAEFSFSGFYPEWSEDLKSKGFWKCFNKYIAKRYSKFNNLEIHLESYDNDIIKVLDSTEFSETVHELVYRSALSILIRGGFVNLLKAALTVKMPIDGFYDKLVDYAKEIGSEYCYKVLVENK